jgi:DNA-binding XRE family transcriptional regulator
MTSKRTPARSDRFVSQDGEFTVKLTPEQQARHDDLAQRQRLGGRRTAQQRRRLKTPPPLAALRTAEGRTQEEIASGLGVRRETVVRLEKQDDLLVSTLCSYVQQLGGHVELVVGDQRIPLETRK